MTSRRNNDKIETIIENCRSEGKWPRVIELAEELKNGSPNYGNHTVECLAHFLIGEGKLECFLEDNPPIEVNFGKAKAGLGDAKNYLNLVTGDDGKRAGIALDAHLLLAKLYFACGQFDECLENFSQAELNSLSEKELTLRSLKILAESYAIKGLCLENFANNKSGSKYKQAERETEMIACFERAADLGLLYLQDQDVIGSSTTTTVSTNTGTLSSSTSLDSRKMSAILETALQRAPIVLIKVGKLQDAVQRYRSMLSAIETHSTQILRLTLARQLAEVLLRGVSGTIYTPPSISTPTKSSSTPKRLWTPKKYAGRNQFMPKNLAEETILLLLIAEALAVRDVVLSQSPEFRAARTHSLDNATAVYDLLTLASIRWGQVGLLHESFEKALKFSFGEQHIWRQYALCLVVLARNEQAVKALKESSKLTPHDTIPCLMSSRICYESLNCIQEGLDWAHKALNKDNKGLRPSRAQLYVGIGFQQLASNTALKSTQEKYSKLALEALEKAVHQDPNDHLSEYYLALQHALNYNIIDALVHIRIALSLRAEHANSLHLFALLLTANRRPREALMVVDDALEEFPDNLNLLHVKAHLELYLQDADTALITVKQMLHIWRELYESQTNSVDGTDERNSDTRSIFQMHSTSDKDSNLMQAVSLAASRVEQALSEAASSLSSFSPRPGPQGAWMIQLKIWLLLADVYLAIDHPHEAMFCVQEASQIYPLSHHIMYMRGQIHVHLSQANDAKQCFLNAVTANPGHSEALRALGETHLVLGEPRLAEKMIKDAAKIDPNCPNIWFSLGKVMETLGDYNASADCMAAALQLEPTCPVLPFTSIALTFE